MKTPTTISLVLFMLSTGVPNTFSQNQIDKCINGYILCSNTPVTINSFSVDNESNLESRCHPVQSLKNEITFFWSMKDQGHIEFDLTPTNPNDDLDFILYEVDSNNIECNDWKIKRCMASGPNLIDQTLWEPCVGQTGLVKWGDGNMKSYGCKVNESNYLTSLGSQAGAIFALKVMNFTSYSGFTLEFNGSLAFNPSSSLPFRSIALEESDLQILQSGGCVEKAGNVLTDIDASLTNAILQIYPNPSTNEIMLTSNLQIISIKIYNPEGKLLSQIVVPGTSESKIDISNFHSGLYFFEIVDANGTTYTRSIIKN